MNRIPEPILNNLKKYHSHQPSTCWNCGYVGAMGFKKRIIPWYATWWFLILAIVSAIVFPILLALPPYAPYVVGLVFAVIRATSVKSLLSCPHCELDVITK